MHSKFWKSAEVINRVMKACSWYSGIVFLWFCQNIFTSDIDSSEFGSSYFLFFLFFSFLFLLFLLISLCFLFNKLLYFCYLFLGSSHMMIWALIRTLILFFLILIFVLFDSLFDLSYLLFFIIQIRIIGN